MITATHRIITDECRHNRHARSVEEAIVGAMTGWPIGDGTRIHVKVKIERDEEDA